ncbi:hypothetical protein MTYM_02217 [Methylococcales bacterium]|nr:hypothetical protein MTYM_02217 [Methylococcales bacterium]
MPGAGLERAQGNNNAQTLFGIHEIPSDNHIRTLPDATPPDTLKPVCSFLFNVLEQAGAADAHRSVGDMLLLAFDGTEHFSSQASIATAARQGGTPTSGDPFPLCASPSAGQAGL